MCPTMATQCQVDEAAVVDDEFEYHTANKSAKPRGWWAGCLPLALTCLCPCHSKRPTSTHVGWGWTTDALRRWMDGGYQAHALEGIATHCGRHPNAKLSISVCYASSYSGLRRCREEALGTGDPGSDVVRSVMLSHTTGTADGREAGASIPLHKQTMGREEHRYKHRFRGRAQQATNLNARGFVRGYAIIV